MKSKDPTISILGVSLCFTGLVLIIGYFLIRTTTPEDNVFFSRAKEVGLVKINKETKDTLYFDTRLKYVLTGKSRFFGD